MKTECAGKGGCLQRDSVEHGEYAEVYSTESREVDRKDGADLLEKVLDRGNLSPLLANIYLDKFDKEFEGRGVKVVRYADDILLLAKSIRAAERLLGTSTAYLEKKLKLKVNIEKSRAVSVYSIRNFDFSALRWERTKRVHIFEFTQSRRRKPKTNCEN